MCLVNLPDLRFSSSNQNNFSRASFKAAEPSPLFPAPFASESLVFEARAPRATWPYALQSRVETPQTATVQATEGIMGIQSSGLW